VNLVLAGAAFAAEPDASTIDTLRRRIGAVRGVGVAPVEFRSMDPAAAVAYQRQVYNSVMTEDDWLHQGLVLAALGLIDDGRRYQDVVLGMVEFGVSGFYDPLSDVFVTVARPGDDLALILGHELVHALQDQAFDLGPYLAPHAMSHDASLAFAALMEGDATFTERWVSQGRAGRRAPLRGVPWQLWPDQPAPEVPDQLPIGLVELQMFQYTVGSAFVQHLQTQGGWAAVNGAYRDPPASTEQVLHPERLRRDLPTVIHLPTTALDGVVPGLRGVVSDTVGELTLVTMLRASGAPDPLGAADGWDGDRLVVLEGPDGRSVAAWRTRWDSEADAAVARDALAHHFGSTSVVEQRGAEVTVLRGALAQDVGPLLQAVWAAPTHEATSSAELLDADALAAWRRAHR
jgi:hypothetical protein